MIMREGDLQTILMQMTFDLGLPPNTLWDYACEIIPIKYDPQPEDNSLAPTGVEGIALFALVRALRPNCVLEVGNRSGNSTQHLIKALRENGTGHLWTLDNTDWQATKPQDSDLATTIIADLFNYDYHQIAPIDFIFEDSFHQPAMVGHLWQMFQNYGSNKAIILSHDAAHHEIGPGVRAGIERVTTQYTVYHIQPAQCGFAMGVERG